GVLDDVASGSIRRLAFVVPSGCSWPVPLYELALLSAGRATESGIEADVTVVTPEGEPLELLGTEASRLVAELLRERGARFIGRAAPTGVLRDGSLQQAFDAPIRSDRVVAIPQLRGQRSTG